MANFLEELEARIRTLAQAYGVPVYRKEQDDGGFELTIKIGTDVNLSFCFNTDGEYTDWYGGYLDKPGALQFLKAVFAYPE